MSVEDDYRRRVIQENLVKLVDRLSPNELLPHLPCLSRQSQQKIRCRLAQEGQQAATVLLLDDLPRKDNWWEQLMAALCHPAVGQEDLAELLQTQEEIFRGINKKSEKLQLIAEVHKGAPQNGEMHAYKTKGKVGINWSSPLRKLPFSVVKVLQRLDVDSKWKDLAAQTGYTVEQVNILEAYTDKDGGHVQKLYRDLQTRYNFTLSQLVDVLQNIERFDILDDLSDIKELKHLEWSKRMTPKSSFENQTLQPSIDNQIKTALSQNIQLNEIDEIKTDCRYQKAECKSNASNRTVSNNKVCTCNDEGNSESSMKRILTALGVIAVFSFTLHRCVFR